MTVTLGGEVFTDEDFVGDDGLGHAEMLAALTTRPAERRFPSRVFARFLEEADSKVNATGLALTATSTTSMTIANTSTVSPNVGAGKGFSATQRVRIARTSNPAIFMEGVITAFNQGTGAMTVALDYSNGAGGPFTDWTITPAGAVGATGATGSMAALTQVERTTNTQLGASDSAKSFTITGSGGFSQTFDTSNLGSTWWCLYKNASTGIITLSATIDGISNPTLFPGEAVEIQYNGTTYRTVGSYQKDYMRGQLYLARMAGF